MPYSSEFLAEIKTLVKAQLKQLGAFVDEELPDYIMVMVANKKKRDSMNNDLQLFLGNQTEKFTEWLHELLESHGSSNSGSKPASIIVDSASMEKKKKVAKTGVDKKISRRVSRSSREHRSRSRSRSPLALRDAISSSSSLINADADIISVRTDENEFVEESTSVNALDSASATATSSNQQKEQRRIVSTSSLPGKSDCQVEAPITGLRSLVKVTTHQPSSTTVAPHMRPVGLLLKRAMNEAQASVKSPPPTVSPTLLVNSRRPAAVVRGRKRPAEEPLQSLNSGDEDDFPKAKSTRFVVTLNETSNFANTSTALSSVKARLGPRIAQSDQRQISGLTSHPGSDDASSELIDVRDILIAKKLKRSQKLISGNEAPTQRIRKRISAEQLKKILPMVINLNDTDEDEALVSSDSVPTPEMQTSAIAPPHPKRENIPSTLERCKYWPSCRNVTTCQFIHPKEECKSFPKCRFGEKCLYLHPACKFGASCSRVGCPFSHAGQLPYQAPQVMGVITCRFVPNCKNSSCPFYHPPGPVANPVAASAIAKICRFGSMCANRTTCPFSHPKASSLSGRIPASHKLKWIAPGKSTLPEVVVEPTTVS